MMNLAPPAPHEYADKCVTSVPERLKLYGEARPKPPTLRRRARKTPKILPSAGAKLFGRNAFEGGKSAILTHFSDNFQIFEMNRML